MIRRSLPIAAAVAFAFAPARAFGDEPVRVDAGRAPDDLPTPPSPPPLPEPPREMRQVLLLRTVVLGDKSAKAAKRAGDHEVDRGQQLDKILSDAVQDLGFTLDVSDDSQVEGVELSDLELLAHAKGDSWLVYPTLDLRGPDTVVRIAGVARGSNVVTIRTEVVKPHDLPVRAVVMLRDVVAARPGSELGHGRREPERVVTPSFVAPARSQGRAVLALNGAALGAYVGYSVQRSSGSDDPRLLYPLMALGTGVGLGAAAIVTEEWDVGLGEAWYLSAGAWWPALSGWYLARGSGDVARSTAYGTSVIAAFAGLGAATVALSLHHGMSEGGALMTHSGGAFGTGLGALAEFAVRGTTTGPTPEQGIGYGAAIGVTVAGALATQVEVEPSRVLAVDLGAALGGLAGAAAGSPFIFGERTPSGDRAFLATTMACTVAGGVLSWIWTARRPQAPPPPLAGTFVLPFAGAILPARRELDRTELPPPREPLVLGVGLMGSLR